MGQQLQRPHCEESRAVPAPIDNKRRHGQHMTERFLSGKGGGGSVPEGVFRKEECRKECSGRSVPEGEFQKEGGGDKTPVMRIRRYGRNGDGLIDGLAPNAERMLRLARQSDQENPHHASDVQHEDANQWQSCRRCPTS